MNVDYIQAGRNVMDVDIIYINVVGIPLRYTEGYIMAVTSITSGKESSQFPAVDAGGIELS